MIRLFFLLLLSPLAVVYGQSKLPIFDAHLHYNVEAWEGMPVDKTLALFRANNIIGILANSRPNLGTHKLLAGKGKDGLAIVPFVRVYRDRSDYGAWYKKTEVYEHIVEELNKEPRMTGIGEFHLHGDEATHPGVKRVVELAQQRGLWLHAHVDETALRHLLAIAPKAKIIWAHTGFSTPHANVAEILATHPHVVAELSYRGDITEADKLTSAWRALFTSYPDRFVLGSDTWVNQRWDSYADTMKAYRAWLYELPHEVAMKIAYQNAFKIFDIKL